MTDLSSLVTATTRHPSGAVVLALKGEMDHTTAPATQDDIMKAVQEGAPRVVLDLAAVSFLDSSGINSLLRIRQQLAEGQRLVLAAPQPVVARIFEVVALTTLLACVPDVESALTAPDPQA